MEVKTEGCPVAVEVPVEIVPEQSGELFSCLNVAARVDHVTAGQGLVESRVVPSVQLVHHHLPHGMGPGRAISTVPVALVGHPEVEGVGPDGHTAKGRGNGRVIDKELVGHHFELLVTAHSKIGGSHPDDGAICDVCETFDDQPRAGHFCQPIIVAALGPVLGIILVGQGEHCYLVATTVEILDRRVVGVFVRDEKGSSDLATVGILSLPVEDFLVEVDVVHVHSTVERDRDHLGHLGWLDVPRDPGAVGGTVAVGEHALGWVAVRRTVRVRFHR